MKSTGLAARALRMTGTVMCRNMATAAAMLIALVVAPLAPATADNERGAALFDLCAQCHGEQAQGKELFLAPAIAGLGEWYLTSQLNLFRSGARGLHHGDVGGLRMVPMSRFLRGDADVKAVAAYVAGLPQVTPVPALHGGDAAKGQAA